MTKIPFCSSLHHIRPNKRRTAAAHQGHHVRGNWLLLGCSLCSQQNDPFFLLLVFFLSVWESFGIFRSLISFCHGLMKGGFDQRICWLTIIITHNNVLVRGVEFTDTLTAGLQIQQEKALRMEHRNWFFFILGLSKFEEKKNRRKILFGFIIM